MRITTPPPRRPSTFQNRYTCSWKLAGTKNFRLASSKLLGFYGGNCQNPSPSLMRCIVPDENNIFLQRDQSGAEALIVAYECRRAKFRKLFELGIKPHSYTALQIFTDTFRGEHPASRYKSVEPSLLVTYPEYKELFKTIKKAQREYDLGKRVRHAKNYKMGPRTFQINCLEATEGAVNLTYKQSKDFLSIDDEIFPEILEWHSEIKEALLHGRTLRNLFGYPRLFTAIWSEGLLRDACAFIPQSTVGTITNLAFVELDNFIRAHRKPWLLLNNKHDSILLECPDTAEHREEAGEVMRDAMELPLRSTKGEEYAMKTELSTGHNWAKYDEQLNPEGMKEA